MNTATTHKRTYLSRHQTGLSLVELMISLTIGLILLMGLTTLIVQQTSTRDELEKTSREIENGRYAMQLLHDDIQLAGFYGEYSPASGVAYTVPDPCNASSGWGTAPTVPVAVYGYAGATASPTCVPADRSAGTAILVVRRTATTTTSVASAVAGTTYLQVSRCSTAATPFVFGTTASNTNTALGGFVLTQKDCLTPALLRQYTVDIYYISTCSVPAGGAATCTGTADDNGNPIPTLKMVQVGSAAGPVTTPLVEGIENMQFDYGIDNTGDGAPDSYTTTPSAANWQNIMAVRVNLLARNNDPTTGYTDTKTYSLGGASAVTPGGAYKRHAYSELTRTINPSGRRE